MIQLEGISKGFGGQALFRDVEWRIAERERIGLVGPNGAGKTTLCRILAGVEEPDTGQVSRPRGVTVGYLPQEAAGQTMGSVLAEALSGFEAVWALEREMEDVARALETAPSDALTEQYGDLQHRFDALGGYRLETQARTILSGLGFRSDQLGQSLTEFSGGWRMRAALARLLLLAPSLLLLDEPTNHLDLASLAWLEAFLADYDGTVVVVSHDRYFLNRMVTSIADLTPEGLVVYPGDYDDFLVEREARRELLEARARNQAKRIAEVERFIERFRYKATKARQVQSRIKMLDKVERIEVPGARAPDPLRVPGAAPHRPAGGHAAPGSTRPTATNVVYAGIDVAVERGDRLALVGDNGAGKSTLLKMLAGVLPFDRGERTLGSHVAVHYYAQHQLDALDPTPHRAGGAGGGGAGVHAHAAAHYPRRLPVLRRQLWRRRSPCSRAARRRGWPWPVCWSGPPRSCAWTSPPTISIWRRARCWRRRWRSFRARSSSSRTTGTSSTGSRRWSWRSPAAC